MGVGADKGVPDERVGGVELDDMVEKASGVGEVGRDGGMEHAAVEEESVVGVD